MRHLLPFLILCVLGMLGSAGCFFGGDPASEPGAADFQATVDAALARIATPENNPAPTVAASPAARDPVPVTPTPSSPQAVAPNATQVIPTLPPQPVELLSTYLLSNARNWEFATQNSPAVVAQIQRIGWVADGLQTVDEFNAVERMVNIGIQAPETLSVLLDAGGLQNQLRPMDLPALLSLQRMAQDRPERLEQLTHAGWFRDGLTTSESAIVAVLYERSRFLSPEFDAIVADPGILTVELGNTANRAGAVVPIAILRSGPAPPGSPVMDTARVAVPVFEGMFDAPFPTPAVVFHVTEYVAGIAAGTNYQTHITLQTDIDTGARPDFAPHAVFHEIAHYYLYAKPEWYAEGGADFAASFARNTIARTPLETTNFPCYGAVTLSELDLQLANAGGAAQVDPNLWRCNYYLGERLLMSLYHQLGEERFLEGWRALYDHLARDPSYPSQWEFSETDIRVEWLRAGGMQMQPDLEHIWDQWHRGRTAREVQGPPDPSPVDPSLTGINGRIDQAYIALATDGQPVGRFSASDVDGWALLTLKYTYELTGGPQELSLEMVEYFEDGFTNGRRNVTIPVQPQFAGGTQWLSVGPVAPLRWAPGRYWVYVYLEGRKVAEVQFEVTP